MPSLRSPLLGFALGSLILALLQASMPTLPGADAWYHLRISAEGPGAWVGEAMPAMRYTVFDGGNWVDHQLLFHALAWPFTWFLPLPWVGRVVPVLVGAAVCAALAWVLDQKRVPWAWAWAVALLGLSWFFDLRLEMMRVQGLSVLFMLLGMGLAQRGTTWGLGILGFVFAWTYHVALLLPLAIAVSAWDRRDPRPVVGASLGVGLGFVLHPQSPRALEFLWLHVIMKVANQEGLAVGGEWYPLSTAEWLWAMGPCLLLLAGVLALARSVLADDTKTRLLLALLWLGVSLTAAKWIEYAIPFAVVAIALAARDARLPRWLPLTIAALLPFNAHRLQGYTANQLPSHDRLAKLGQALPATDCRVFHANWADWAELYYHAPQCQFIVGLDPHFMVLADPDRARLLKAAAFGQVPDLSGLAHAAFDSTHVVVTHPWIADQAAQDPHLAPIAQGTQATLYRVLPR